MNYIADTTTYPGRTVTTMEANCDGIYKKENVTEYPISYVESLFFCITIVSTIGKNDLLSK